MMNGPGDAQRENSDAQQALATFWQRQLDEVGQNSYGIDPKIFKIYLQMRGLGPIHFKQQELPLARIKKIMKVNNKFKF